MNHPYMTKVVNRSSHVANHVVHPLPGNDAQEAMSCFATHDAWGIVDLGASKTVIGSQHVSELIRSLDSTIRSQLQRCPCNITFRFGNEGTLSSEKGYRTADRTIQAQDSSCARWNPIFAFEHTDACLASPYRLPPQMFVQPTE